ncbi:MAG: zeta toxin family protein [Pseudomonadota bacterium]
MSPASARPTLFLIAGPNGAGKTTFYETALRPRIAAPFINADEIQREELKDPSVEAAYRAAAIAAERREKLLAAGESFVTETVFSHPSKLELLKAARGAGFRLIVFHLHVASADLAVARVLERIEEGGHPVPEDKVRERHARNQELIRAAVRFADHGAVYDSSALNAPPRLLLRTRQGAAEFVAEDPPDWFSALYGPP